MRLSLIVTMLFASNIIHAEVLSVPFHDVAAKPRVQLQIKYNLTKHQTMTCDIDGVPIQVRWIYKGNHRLATRRDAIVFSAKKGVRAEPIDAKGFIYLSNYGVDGKMHLASCRYS